MGNKTDPDLVRLFADRMRHLRTQRRFTQEELGLRAGLHTETISRLERGKMQPSITVVIGVARALGCGVAELLEREPGSEHVLMSSEERQLLERYRAINAAARAHLMSLLLAL